MKRVDIMLDLETLGRAPDAPILEIGAVQFDIKTGKLIDEFDVSVCVTDRKDIYGATLMWWLDTNSELLKELLHEGSSSGLSEEEAVSQLLDWIAKTSDGVSPQYVYLWGCGISFDNTIISRKVANLNLEYPVVYRNDRDVRSFLEGIALANGYESEYELRTQLGSRYDKLQRHRGIDDAKLQAHIICDALRIGDNNEKA